MHTIKVQRWFSASHTLDKGPEKCVNSIHGHNWLVEAYFSEQELNEMGMVMDFGVVGDTLEGILEELDHSLIIQDTPQNRKLVEAIRVYRPKQKVFFMKNNPTAENMSILIFDKLQQIILSTCKVVVHENYKSSSEFVLGED